MSHGPPPREATDGLGDGARFSRGDLVRLKARPSTVGAVTEVLGDGTETRYHVCHDGAVFIYYASQVEPAQCPPKVQIATPQALHAALTALQLRHPSTRHLYSLHASRIQFVPYQFRPVLKFIQADRPRILIADEVGVGKTIEAGLILKELQARRDLRSVLVICPRPLVTERKWREEMRRFDEQFEHLDGRSLRYCLDETHLDGIWPQRYTRAILPFSLFDETLFVGRQKGRQRQRGLVDLDPAPAFDLVIVDEAHHIRNPETWVHRCVRYFCDNAEAVVLMSATPVQLHSGDLFQLLHLLRPDLISTRRDFELMAEPNQYLNQAIEVARAGNDDWRENVRHEMAQALETAWGRGVLASDPRLPRLHDCLATSDGSAEARLSLIHELEGLYTFSGVINRTRRRDIGAFTTRKPETITVEFTPEQAGLHQDLLELMGRLLALRHGNVNLKFLLTTLRRQAASCIFGLAPRISAILARQVDQVELSEMDADEEGWADLDEVLPGLEGEIGALLHRAENLRGPDPKLEALLQVIRDKQRLPNNKLLLFSTFRHTLAYLESRLAEEDVRFGVVHGGTPDDERRELRERFSRPRSETDALDLLLSSEVGCEGLDYQFCDGLVNYDLPWNPMRIEQRIGRIDRYGQKSEAVAIYNLITPGTVDAEIYERCLLRIGVFRQALGGSEEVLGRITQEIRDIADNLELSLAEQAERLQQLSDNKIRFVQEQDRLEEEETGFFGLRVPPRDDAMVKDASSLWLSPAMLRNLVEAYLAQLDAGKAGPRIGNKPLATVQFSEGMRKRLLAVLQSLDVTGALASSWERWLKGPASSLRLTFDPSVADDHRDVAFITPTHPLARQAAHAMAPAAPLACQWAIATRDVPPGRHPFAIYSWQKIGLRDEFAFQPVCAHGEMADHLLELLQTASAAPDSSVGLTSEEEGLLEQAHRRLWSEARERHVEGAVRTAASRLASLATTHSARMAWLAEQRDNASDERIRRMHGARMATATRDYDRRAAELARVSERSDILVHPVALGVLMVEVPS